MSGGDPPGDGGPAAAGRAHSHSPGSPDPLISLVGAGPGDPGLLTVRGRELLSAADAVVVDALAPDALLMHCRDGVEVHHVGKRAGAHAASQADIDALLVDLGRRGVRTVRLKGGDPFVFGRGGEECEALRAAGVPYEVVPGVTSAVAVPAYLGIPVTHRDHAGHVTIVTAHESAERGPAIDWPAMAPLLRRGTLVVLMGARALPRVLEALVTGGADPDCPAVSIEWGTTPRQRSVTATIASLGTAVGAAGLGAPLCTVIGRVVELGSDLAWFDRPLHGRRVLVTRADVRAGGLCVALERRGAEVVHVPLLATEPLRTPALLGEDVKAAVGADALRRIVVFTSAVTADLVLEAIRSIGADSRLLSGTVLACVGPETERALARAGLRADVVGSPASSEGLADGLERIGLDGAAVWLPRAEVARDVLPQRLRDAGARVTVTPVYRTVLPQASSAALREAVSRGLDAITLASGSAASHLAEALDGLPLPPTCVVACIGPITAATARAAGLHVQVVASEPSSTALADELVRELAMSTGIGAATTVVAGGTPDSDSACP